MIFRSESRNILGKFCGNSVDKFFEIFLDTRSDSCYNRLGESPSRSRHIKSRPVSHFSCALWRTRFILKISVWHFGAERAKLNANENHSHLQVKEKTSPFGEASYFFNVELYEKCLEVSSNP